MPTDNEIQAEAFLNSLCEGLKDDERLILCGFPGDPDAVPKGAWRPRPWRPGREIPFGTNENAYATVSAFGKAADGTYRRRSETWRAGLALMVDDVGTKVSREVVASMPPTARIETSAGNQQWWYFLRSPITDIDRFDQIIRAFIATKLLGADPGMSGVTRVGRIPGFRNGKPKYGNDSRVKVVTANYERRYSMEVLIKGFGLQSTINEIGMRRLNGHRLQAIPAGDDVRARIMGYEAAVGQLKRGGALKRGGEPDAGGWIEIVCPWIEEHTGAADNGAAIREPAAENGWYGAFRCHHGSHKDKHWPDLTEYLADIAAERLGKINDE